MLAKSEPPVKSGALSIETLSIVPPGACVWQMPIPGINQESQTKRRNTLTIVGILVVIILVLLVIYLFRRV
jgi:flagellar biogenesis protein FliO